MALLKRMLRNRIWLTTLTVVVSVCSICVSFLWNSQLSVITNLVYVGIAIPTPTLLSAGSTMLISAGTAYILSLCSSWTCETLVHDLRMGYAKHFAVLQITEIENMNAGEQLSKLQNEMADVSGFLRANLFSIIDDLIKFIGTCAWLLWLNPTLTLFANAPVALVVWYTVYSSKIIGQAAQESQQANTIMTGFADTLIVVFPILRLFHAAPLICKQYDDVLQKWEAAIIKEEHRRARLMSLSGIISYVPLLMLFLVGGQQIIQGTITIGTFYVFINLSGNVSGVMVNMPGRIAQFRRFVVNMKRLEPSVLVDNGGDKDEHSHRESKFLLWRQRNTSRD